MNLNPTFSLDQKFLMGLVAGDSSDDINSFGNVWEPKSFQNLIWNNMYIKNIHKRININYILYFFFCTTSKYWIRKKSPDEAPSGRSWLNHMKTKSQKDHKTYALRTIRNSDNIITFLLLVLGLLKEVYVVSDNVLLY